MNPQETQKVVARDEKWVPSTERVKISSLTNVRLEITVQQKEETFQVIIDVIKNSMCFKAFTITAEVPEILMHQFWYTIKKVKDSESYEFLLANKKCIFDVEVFKKILDICLRVEGEEFTPEDGIVSRLKFVRIGEDYQEYGLHVPDTMLNDTIIQSESYQMFLKYSTGQIPPKKSRGKGSQGKKTTDTLMEDVDVSEECRFGIRIGSRSTRSVVIQDTLSAPKSKPATSKLKLKGIPSLTLEEQLAADTMQALKESKKPNRRQPGTGGSSEGTGIVPGVPDESIVVSATLSEGTSGDKEVDWIDYDDVEEKKDDTNDDKSIDLEMTDDEETESRNGDEEDTDAAKEDAEKTEESKDDSNKAESY
ncbi:hypothetical protein Tco_1103812 [Tanacetum coccineum]